MSKTWLALLLILLIIPVALAEEKSNNKNEIPAGIWIWISFVIILIFFAWFIKGRSGVKTPKIRTSRRSIYNIKYQKLLDKEKYRELKKAIRDMKRENQRKKMRDEQELPETPEETVEDQRFRRQINRVIREIESHRQEAEHQRRVAEATGNEPAARTAAESEAIDNRIIQLLRTGDINNINQALQLLGIQENVDIRQEAEGSQQEIIRDYIITKLDPIFRVWFREYKILFDLDQLLLHKKKARKNGQLWKVKGKQAWEFKKHEPSGKLQKDLWNNTKYYNDTQMNAAIKDIYQLLVDMEIIFNNYRAIETTANAKLLVDKLAEMKPHLINIGRVAKDLENRMYHFKVRSGKMIDRILRSDLIKKSREVLAIIEDLERQVA